MSEYDMLLRSRPELLKDAQEKGEEDLAERTKLFRSKLDSLEKAHSEILTSLVNKRDEQIDQISREIAELENGKQERLKQYEEEIHGLSSAYESMLRDERARQDSVNADIRKAKAEQEKFLANIHNEDLSLSSDFREEKKRLEEMHKLSLEESAAKFTAQSRALKQDFEDLINERKALNADIAFMVNEYKKFDDEIAEKQLQLRYECNEKLLEVRKLLEEDQQRRKEKLNILDILKDDAEDITD